MTLVSDQSRKLELGVDTPKYGRPHPLLRKLNKATNNQAIMLTLAVQLAAVEDSTGVHTWRSPSAADKRYFTALQDWGYTLSPVERLVLDPDADAADWPGLHGDATTNNENASDNQDDWDEADLDDLDEQVAELIPDTAA